MRVKYGKRSYTRFPVVANPSMAVVLLIESSGVIPRRKDVDRDKDFAVRFPKFDKEFR